MDNVHELTVTPFADQLIEKKSLGLISVHALPINNGRSLKKSSLLSKYQELYGDEYLTSDVTYTGNVMDNPIKPEHVLKESESITAKAFGAKKTFYTTMGTTLSNYIVVYGLSKECERVLVDKNCHQSIHFALQRNRNLITYSENKKKFQDSGRLVMDVDNFLFKYEQAYKEGKPYKLVVLNGCSYEGVMYDIEKIIESCIQIHDDVHFFVDEAWSAHGYFHPFFKRYTAMNAANELRRKYPNRNISVTCTQSAHKSLSSLRQGSYIHVNSSEKVIQEISMAKYMLHTTSPSYPILASLELARAQMALEGYNLIEEQLQASKKLQNALQECNYLKINYDELDYGWYRLDPTKISINFTMKELPIEYIKSILLKLNIYINRKTETSILFNLHIGIKDNELSSIIQSLYEIENLNVCWLNTQHQKQINYEPLPHQDNADYYLIAYPPGVPFVVPGDKIDNQVCYDLQKLQLSGVSLIKSKINKKA
ncbi:hypothetical protein [Bacillus cereus]|uniref:hypothetical protein n=1 Tax=Bacillus cereus TaxID=1396 RepID=UPI0015D4FAA0|nr:hypothetical protein [Bacillus cereus]